MQPYWTKLSQWDTQINAWTRKRTVKKALPLLTRIFLVATFIEDSVRGILQRKLQILFLQHIYRVPYFLAAAFLFSCIIMALGASSCIVLRWHEDRAAWMLLGYIALQQALYGKYAPQGKWGFFVRNLCICGSLLILVANSRLKKGYALLPGLGKSANAASHSRFPEYIQLASRCLMALLSLEFVTSMGWIGTLLSLPVVLSVLVGFKTQLCALLLMGLYAIHNVLASAFWYLHNAGASWEVDIQRDVKLFEFVQTISIMGGLGLLSSSGPGALSFDEQRKKY
ncbi:hypothetical protein GAYE_SCF22MG4199 [Galdieria yellowstonensis]|uniref:Surfeit locus protein 4 n=1 Tax=Galdieria yellowstonensis TaxID=3028027 RepID=A0AAV9IFR2_9RHOD|nr:hypothetical protein GAYE_SCF22MG4199 [Galdieria yellowstonensis]